jgi:cytochrome c-type biogenesis protein CcmH
LFDETKGNPMQVRFWLAILVTLILMGAAFSGVSAQTGTQPMPSDDEVNAVAKQLYCPVCENIPLDVCPTQACTQWRELIREKLAGGWSEEQIKMYFVDQYGDRVLATPPARGLNWLVYLIPPLAIITGGFILFRAFQAWKQPIPQTPGAEANSYEAPQNEYIARLEEELKKR